MRRLRFAELSRSTRADLPLYPLGSGERMERERNIVKNRPSFRSLDRDRQQEALNLVSRMVAFDSRAR